MKKRILFLSVSMLLFSCSFDLNNTKIRDNIPIKTKHSFNDFEKSMIQKILNKKNFNTNPNIKINTGLFSNNKESKIFSLKSIKETFDITNIPKENIIFQEKYTTETNKIFEIVKQFKINDISKEYTIYIKSDSDKNNPITVTFTLNGYEYLRNKNFIANEETFENHILLKNNNELSIKLECKNKSTFTIMIIKDTSKDYIRKNYFPLGKHSTNKNHLNEGDFNIFDPNDLQSISKLDPYQGNKITDNLNSSLMSINDGKWDISFQTEYIGLKFRAGQEDKLNDILKRYNAKVEKRLFDFYILKIDTKTANINKIEELITKLNKSSVDEIDNISFSSISALQTFTIYLDMVFNFSKELEVVEINFNNSKKRFNYAPNQNRYEMPISPPDDWDNFLYGHSEGFKTHSDIIYNWEKSVTGVIDAWKVATGKGVKVSVIDSYFNLDHPEMIGKYEFDSSMRVDLEKDLCSENEEFKEMSKYSITNGQSDYHKYGDCGYRNHGHYVTMLGFASKNNNIGSSGIAPDTKVLTYPFNGGLWADSDNIVKASQNGAKVINLSWGTSLPSWLNVILYNLDSILGSKSNYSTMARAVQYAKDKKTAVVASTNERPSIYNENIDNDFPSGITNVIAVGAIAVRDRLANNGNHDFLPNFSTNTPQNANIISNQFVNNIDFNFSNPNLTYNLTVGQFSSYGNNLIYAPGEQIYVSSAKNFSRAGFDLTLFNGTSAAAPFVSGVLALMYEVNPSLDVDTATSILKNAHRYQADPSNTMLNDSLWGSTRVNMLDAFLAVNETAKRAGKIYPLDQEAIRNLNSKTTGLFIQSYNNTFPGAQPINCITNKQTSVFGIAIAGDVVNTKIFINDNGSKVPVEVIERQDNLLVCRVNDKIIHNTGIKDLLLEAPNNNFSIPNVLDVSPETVETSTGDLAYVVASNSKITITSGQKIAVPINESIASRLGSISMGIGNTNLTFLEIVKNYAIYGIPDYNPLTMSTIRNQILSLLVKDTSGNTIYSINDALKFAAFAINLNPKYPDGGSVLSYAPFIMNNTNNDANKIIKVKQGDIAVLSVDGLKTNDPVGVYINSSKDDNFPIYKRDGNIVYFKIPVDAKLGIIDVFFDSDTTTDRLIFHNAIEVIKGDPVTSQTNRFPSSITVNGVTTQLDYGFNFDFSEASGNTVFDRSGKNNNGEFATLHGLLPLRINNDAIKFQAGSYITVPYSPSYNLPRKFAFLTTLKLHEKNRQQVILYKWDDGYINGQFVHSYGFYISDDNKITLTIADNRIAYYSITYNANIPFDLEKEVGIAVIVDLDTKTVKMVKNQTVVDGSILYDGIWYHYSSLNQFDTIKNSVFPLSIGNCTSVAQGDYSLSLNLNADLTNVSSVISEVTPEQVSKIFYDMGLRD